MCSGASGSKCSVTVTVLAGVARGPGRRWGSQLCYPIIPTSALTGHWMGRELNKAGLRCSGSCWGSLALGWSCSPAGGGWRGREGIFCSEKSRSLETRTLDSFPPSLSHSSAPRWGCLESLQTNHWHPHPGLPPASSRTQPGTVL